MWRSLVKRAFGRVSSLLRSVSARRSKIYQVLWRTGGSARVVHASCVLPVQGCTHIQR